MRRRRGRQHHDHRRRHHDVGSGARFDHDHRRGPPRRAVFLWLCVAGSALLAEGLKPIIGRLRPEDTGGLYDLMPLARRLADTNDLGCPSSHTAAAFGAAFALAVCFRPAALIVVAGAAGCGPRPPMR